MQRRDINKRLSFAEENGQKDRNKEEVEEERELGTEKGINKSGAGRGGRAERGGGKERGAPAAGPGPRLPCRFARPTSRSTTFAVYDTSFRIGKLLFPPCAGAGRCIRVSRYPGSHFFRIVETEFRCAFVENGTDFMKPTQTNLSRRATLN